MAVPPRSPVVESLDSSAGPSAKIPTGWHSSVGRYATARDLHDTFHCASHSSCAVLRRRPQEFAWWERPLLCTECGVNKASFASGASDEHVFKVDKTRSEHDV